MHTHRKLVGRISMLGAGALAGVVALSGCASPGTGSAPSATTSISTSTDSALAALVPAEIKSSGVLNIATGAGYPPFEYYDTDNKTIIGFDPDLISAVAGELGLKPKFADLKFDAIIPGLQSKRYDVGSAALGVTAERLKVLDFVSYFKGGTSLMVKTGNPLKLTLTTMCGHTIAAQKGTIYSDDYLPAFNKACTSAGKKAITVGVYPDQPGATLAVSSGRADATMDDYGPLTYVAKQSKGTFEVLNVQYKTTPYGLAVPKGSKLAPAIEAALKKLIANGTYTKILDKWKLSAGAITEPVTSTNG